MTIAETTIALCRECKGAGSILEHRLADYHRREWDHTHKRCRSCAGSGRQLITTTTTAKPYAPPEPDA